MQSGTFRTVLLAASLTFGIFTGTAAAEDWFPGPDAVQPHIARAEGWVLNPGTVDSGATERFKTFWEEKFCMLLFWAQREAQWNDKPHAENQYISKIAGLIEFPLSVPQGMLDIEIESLETADSRFTNMVIGEILVKRADTIISAKPGLGESEYHQQVNAPYVLPTGESFRRMNLCLDFVQDGSGAPWKLRRIRDLSAQ